MGSVFAVETTSVLEVNDSSIENCSSDTTGGVLFVLDSIARFDNVTVSNINAKEEGGFAELN